MKKLLAMLLCLGLAGCATTPILNTPSGRPEVEINSLDKAQIKSTLINEFMNQGFSVVSDTDYSLVFSKKMDGFGGVMYQAMLGNSYSSSPEWFARINFATLEHSTRVVAQAEAHMQNAFGRDDVNDMTNGQSGTQLQQLLEGVKNNIEGISVQAQQAIVQLQKENDQVTTDSKAIEADPNNSKLYITRGDDYYSLKEYGKAILDYNRAIKINPKDGHGYASRMFAFYMKKDYENTRSDYLKSIELGFQFEDAQIYYIKNDPNMKISN